MNPPLKRCIRCGVEKKDHPDFFPRRKGKLGGTCRACGRESARKSKRELRGIGSLRNMT